VMTEAHMQLRDLQSLGRACITILKLDATQTWSWRHWARGNARNARTRARLDRREEVPERLNAGRSGTGCGTHKGHPD